MLTSGDNSINALLNALIGQDALSQGGTPIVPIQRYPYQPYNGGEYRGGPQQMLEQRISPGPGSGGGGHGGGGGGGIGSGLSSLGSGLAAALAGFKESGDQNALATALGGSGMSPEFPSGDTPSPSAGLTPNTDALAAGSGSPYDPANKSAGLSQPFADKLQDLQQDLEEGGLRTTIGEGYRDPARQDALFAQGRTAPGDIVTGVRGGGSYHNVGAAADLIPASGIDDKAAQQQIIDAASESWRGLKSGGTFSNLYDPLHVQSAGSLADARTAYAGGTAVPYATALANTLAGGSPAGTSSAQILADIRKGESANIPGHYDVGDSGSSFGPYQLHMGGLAGGGNAGPGMGDDFKRETGLDPRDPATVPQQTAWVASKLAADPSLISNFHGYRGPVQLAGAIPSPDTGAPPVPLTGPYGAPSVSGGPAPATAPAGVQTAENAYTPHPDQQEALIKQQFDIAKRNYDQNQAAGNAALQAGHNQAAQVYFQRADQANKDAQGWVNEVIKLRQMPATASPGVGVYDRQTGNYPVPVPAKEGRADTSIVHLNDGTFQTIDNATGKLIGEPVGHPSEAPRPVTPDERKTWGLPEDGAFVIEPGKAPTQIAGAGSQANKLDPGEPAVDILAERINKGDGSALTGLGYGTIGANNRAVVLRRAAELKTGQSAADAATEQMRGQVEFGGQKAGARTSGTLGARIDTFAEEAKETSKLALDASNALPRTQFVPLNQIEQMGQAAMSNPAYSSFQAANNAFANTYAKAVNPSGVPTDESRRHAFEILNIAKSPEAYAAGVQKLQDEMTAVQRAVHSIEGQQGGGQQPQGPVRIQGDADFNALPSGATFVGPDGVPRRKP